MSTRAYIGMELPEDKGVKEIKYIYCHFDGYPEGVGKELKNYDTEEKVKELIALGDISTLGPDLDSTEAYARDRGEDYEPNKPKKVISDVEYRMVSKNVSYAYLFRGNKWVLFTYRGVTDLFFKS